MRYDPKICLFTVDIHGIDIVLQDHPDSVTLPFIVGELRSDVYGLERISLGPDDTFLDVGSNCGIVGIYAHKKFGCNVIAFEPVPSTYQNLLANIQHNDIDSSRFQTWNFAVGGEDSGEVVICCEPHRSGNASVFSASGIPFTCPVRSLRPFLYPAPAYLCIDVEGSELDIIEDCSDLLAGIKYIGIEIHRYGGQDPQKVLNRLSALSGAKIFSTFAG